MQWVTPSPLWSGALDQPVRMRRPVLLRYTSDAFMQELAADLAKPTGPELTPRIADKRSYRRRPPHPPPGWSSDLPQIKLYQAAHGHFNLVAASLVCRLPGLPDRTLDLGQDEEVGFVLRRFVPDEKTSEPLEAAWVDQPAADKGWRILSGLPSQLAAGEELLPLFPVTFTNGSARKLLVGLIPTSSADTFKAAGKLSPVVNDRDAEGNDIDPRIDEFGTRVFEPFERLLTAKLPDGAGPARDGFVDASLIFLLDLAELLGTHLPVAWKALYDATLPEPGPDRVLYELLENAQLSSSVNISLRAALHQVWDQRMQILGEVGPKPSPIDLSGVSVAAGPADPNRDVEIRRNVEALRSAILGALPAAAPAGGSPGADAEAASSGASEIPKFYEADGASFVLRCVLRRPKCQPKPLDIVSEPSEPFAIASFFDPDAPARTIWVQLPVRTSIAELRKYPKNVGFALSDQLREQMSRVTDLKKMMDSELASGESIDVGMLCSFSIPIITICALMVLMIFVSLLNIVFWWMPFLKICLPISLKGKQ